MCIRDSTTHYLQEVEALDADIVIIDDGEILARGTQEELIAGHHIGGLRFTVRGPVASETLAGLDVASVQTLDGGEVSDYRIVGDITMAGLLQRFGGETDRLISVERNLPDLESVFMAVTGRGLGVDSDSDEAAVGEDR